MSDKTGVLVKAAPGRAVRPALERQPFSAPARGGGQGAAVPAGQPFSTPARGGGTYLLEVTLKPEFTDSEGLSALGLLHRAGVTAARCVRVGRLYELRGPLNLGHVHVAVRDLLCDCVTQEFRICHAVKPSPNNGNLWRVEVWLKPAVPDPVAESVRYALLELGIPDPEVRCGLAYRITGKCGRNQLEKAAARSLANPVIHRCSVCEAH